MWHVWGKGEVHMEFWCENLREGDHLQDVDVDGTIILKWIFNQLDNGGRELDLSGSRYGQAACSCQQINEIKGCTKCGELKRLGTLLTSRVLDNLIGIKIHIFSILTLK
jgi:hypothetical protein